MQQALERYAQDAAQSVARLIPTVVPVAIPGERDEPILVGSGVLLRVGPSEFLLTAAHVMDKAAGKLHISNREELIPVSGNYSHTTSATGMREDDKFDLALVPLGAEVTSRLRALSFLDVADLAPEHRPTYQTPFASKYLVLGYPASKSRVRSDGSFAIESLKYIGEPQDPSLHKKRGWSEAHHIVIDYDKKRSNTVKGRVTAPDPYGVSGGAVFYLGEGLTINSGSEKLVAIAIEYGGSAGKAIAATRIGHALQGLQLRHPEAGGRIARPASRVI